MSIEFGRNIDGSSHVTLEGLFEEPRRPIVPDLQ